MDTYSPTTRHYILRKGRVAFLFGIFIFVFMIVFLFDLLNSTNVSQVSAADKSQPVSSSAKANNIFETGSKIVNFIQNNEPELKQDQGLTSILVVGVDSRNVELTDGQFINTKPQGQAGTRNSDTIIQIVYNQNNEQIFMISIPRDMGVDVVKDCLNFHGSIHWVYDRGQSHNCPGGGVQTLEEVVENITGIKIQYHLFVTLEAFTEIINTVGETNSNGQVGLWVDNPAAFYELYPKNDYGWESVYFPVGRQFMTADRALRFVRSRHFSSDFSRARRQQILLDAIKDRLLSSDIIFNPAKIISLLDTFRSKVVFSEPENIGEITAFLNLFKKIANDKVHHMVLDPEFGGHDAFIKKQPTDRKGPYYMTPIAWRQCRGNEFCKVKEKIAEEVANPTD